MGTRKSQPVNLPRAAYCQQSRIDRPEATTVEVTFTLPDDRTEAYVLSIFYKGKEVMESREIAPGTTKISVKLSGTGKQTYDLYINDKFHNAQEVNFGG